MPRPADYTLLIICEGKNTEPSFFGVLRNRIMDKIYAIEDLSITIRPEPKEGYDQVVIPTASSITRPERKKRSVLPGKKEVEPDIPGKPPLLTIT